MQIQMEVCNLNECDFLETRFIEYENEEEFLKDGSYRLTHQGKQKGIIMYFIKDGQPLYEYAPWNCNKNQFEKWESEMMIKHKNLTWMQNMYWYLDQVSCVLVLRNKYWFKIAKPKLYTVWNIIEKERISGYQHRAPNKKNKTIIQSKNIISKCHIDINSLLSDNNEVTKNSAINSEESTKIIYIDTEILEKI